MKPSVPILLYHHVAPDRDITPEGFEAQLQSLLDQGYASLSMTDLLDVVQGRKEIDGPAFVLTFDDGYLDNWTHAFPILQKLSIRAIIYLVTGCIGTDAFLSWQNIKAMNASGLVTFGSHTHTHRNFVRQQRYRNLEDELHRSKMLIESHLGQACDHLAWPWGDFEAEWLPTVKKIGYRSSVTTLSGANTSGKDPYWLKRLNVRKPDMGWFVRRLRRNQWALSADLFGQFNGLDRRFKVWWNKESPYSHG